MTVIEGPNPIYGTPTGHPTKRERPKSVFAAFRHKRNDSDGTPLATALSIPLDVTPYAAKGPTFSPTTPSEYAPLDNNLHDLALGELQQNQQDLNQRSPRKSKDDGPPYKEDRGRSPTKSAFSTFKTIGRGKSREPSPTKAKKTKSSTNLAGLLSRPKSSRNLDKLAAGQETRAGRDKENRTPGYATPVDNNSSASATPIYAQFNSERTINNGAAPGYQFPASQETREGEKPWSFQTQPAFSREPMSSQNTGSHAGVSSRLASSPERAARKQHLTSRATPHPTGRAHTRSKSAAPSQVDPAIDPKDINVHLEAMLDRRNIPENQRYKMRNLADTIKMEFIRQDWAEMQAAKADRPGSHGSSSGGEAAPAVVPGSFGDARKSKHGRGKSFTLSRGSKDSSSPTKKQKSDASIRRHFRSKSSENLVGDQPTPSAPSATNGLLSKIKLGQGPGDFVSYLRKVQKPEVVEVGKLHKLRLLLRNETVAWTDDFTKQGGMEEIVGLLYRIMEVEWREEHEDALLHETLLCLKALCTTALALQYLHSIQDALFPKLLHLLFDPEKKGPSEFTTRNIVPSILFTYIESAPPAERVLRAKIVLNQLRDPEPKEEDRPLPFVLEMRRERPYKVWCKEVTNVTKEVFWIFLHHLNVVTLATDKAKPDTPQDTAMKAATADGDHDYMARHFPQERPPVPAAPYVGGVEWDATNYLTSQMDLLNAILACTPTVEERNKLRHACRISGWERCMGGSLRLCKEKFYPSVHEALRTWVAAAAEDGWDVKDVRYGPPPESRSPVKSSGAGARKKTDAAPKIEMPKLDFGLDQAVPNPQTPQVEDTAWL